MPANAKCAVQGLSDREDVSCQITASVKWAHPPDADNRTIPLQRKSERRGGRKHMLLTRSPLPGASSLFAMVPKNA